MYKHSLSCGGMSVYLREMCSVARSTKHCTNPILTLQCAVCFPLSLRLDNYISFLIVRGCVGALVYLSSRGIKKKQLPTSNHFWMCWMFAGRQPHTTTCHAGIKPALEGRAEGVSLWLVCLIKANKSMFHSKPCVGSSGGWSARSEQSGWSSSNSCNRLTLFAVIATWEDRKTTSHTLSTFLHQLATV